MAFRGIDFSARGGRAAIAIAAFALTQVACTTEETPVIYGHVTEILANNAIRVGDKPIRLCGVKPSASGERRNYAAKSFLYNRVHYRKVRCRIAGYGTPCDGNPSAQSGRMAVGQCFFYGRDLTMVLADVSEQATANNTLVRKFTVSLPRVRQRIATGGLSDGALEKYRAQLW